MIEVERKGKDTYSHANKYRKFTRIGRLERKIPNDSLFPHEGNAPSLFGSRRFSKQHRSPSTRARKVEFRIPRGFIRRRRAQAQTYDRRRNRRTTTVSPYLGPRICRVGCRKIGAACIRRGVGGRPTVFQGSSPCENKPPRSLLRVPPLVPPPAHPERERIPTLSLSLFPGIRNITKEHRRTFYFILTPP